MSRHVRPAATALALMVAGGLTLAACGGSSSATSNPSGSDAAAASGKDPGSQVPVQQDLVKKLPDDIQQSGQLRLGISLGSAPDEFKDPSGKITGWEPDLLQDVAAALGLKLVYEPTSFDGLIPGLQANRFDVAVGQMGVTQDRMKVVDFVSTIHGNQLFAVNADSSITVPDLSALCGKSVGTTRGAVEVTTAKQQSVKCKAANKKPIDVHVFQDANQAGQALRAGRVEVFWLGSTAVSYFIKQSDGAVKKAGYYGEPYPWGIAMDKGSGLEESVQGAVQYLINSGRYAKILQKWGLADSGIKQSKINPKTPK